MKLRIVFPLFLLFAMIPSLASFCQTKPSTEESVSWINDKLMTYSSSEIKIQKIHFNPENGVLSVLDARGDGSTIFTKQLININFIGRINIRNESNFIAIDIFPKPSRSCGMIGVPFFDQPFDYSKAREFLMQDNFPISSFAPLGHIQISLKKSSQQDDIPNRITKALFQVLENNGIALQREVF